MLAYLEKKFEIKHRVSVERVVSGIGLANIYEFLALEFPERVNAEVDKEVSWPIASLYRISPQPRASAIDFDKYFTVHVRSRALERCKALTCLRMFMTTSSVVKPWKNLLP